MPVKSKETKVPRQVGESWHRNMKRNMWYNGMAIRRDLRHRVPFLNFYLSVGDLCSNISS
jgi:hypothetical protein